MGSIKQRGEAWQIRWDLPPDPATGRRRQRSATIHGARKDAEQALALTEAEVARGRWHDPKRVTLDEYAERWLEAVATTVRPGTLDAYRTNLNRARRHLGGTPLSRLDGGALTVVYGRMLAQVSPQTVLHTHRVLHRALSDAVRWRIIPTNPAADATPPQPQKRPLVVWTAEQVRQFLDHTRGNRLGSMWRTAATTGLRRGAVAGLTWPHVHGDIIEIARTRVPSGWSTPKTKQGTRRVALDPETARQLREWRKAQMEERLFFGAGYEDHQLVWCWDDGRPLSPSWISRRFQVLRIGAGLPYIRLHDLRHTWATLALREGVPAKVVSDRLGHSGIAITLDTYTDRVEEMDQEAAATVAALFS